MPIRLPETDLKSTQTIGSIELKDGNGEQAGLYFFGKGHGRTVFLFGKYRCTFKTHAECQAFVDGVMTVIEDRRLPFEQVNTNQVPSG